jgi:hypothetical protein
VPSIENQAVDPDSIEHFPKAFVEYIDGPFEELHSAISDEDGLGNLNWMPPNQVVGLLGNSKTLSVYCSFMGVHGQIGEVDVVVDSVNLLIAFRIDLQPARRTHR